MAGSDLGSRARTDCVIVVLHGELDVTNTADTARKLRAVVAPQLRVVDLAGVTFMHCSSARELASARAQLEQTGGALLLTGLQPTVRRLLSLLELIGPLSVSASAEEAM